MAIEIKQQLRLSQQLVMTPQLQQAIKLLQLSRLELADVVTQELQENPVLEVSEDLDEDLVVQMTALALPAGRPVQFLAIVGRWDTPGSTLELAVADEIVYVADDGGGLQVIDVRNPTQPVLLHDSVLGVPTGVFIPQLDRQTVLARSITTQGTRAYLGTPLPTTLPGGVAVAADVA